MEKTVKTALEVELVEIQNIINQEYRTDHLTLPAPPTGHDPLIDEIAALERNAILNPDADKDAVVDKEGTTKEERRNQLMFGVLPKDASKETKAGVGKHSVSIKKVDGKQEIVISSPTTNTEDVIVGEREVFPKENNPNFTVDVIPPVKFKDALVVKPENEK